MSGLDDLAPDQRAVLQMVLQRGRSYDEIAGLLSIDRAAVRQRALDAFDALTPASVLPGPERGLVTDYLLGQLPERVAEQVQSFLAASEIDRAWAQALVEVVAPLTSASLPEIPVGAPLGADDSPAGGPEQASDPPADEPFESGEADSEPRLEPVRHREAPARSAAARERPRSSRRGGAILLGTIGLVIVAVVIVVIAVSSGGGKKPTLSASHTSTVTPTPTSSTSATTATSTTVTSQAMLAQLNLTSPTGAKSTLGIAQVERVDGVIGVVIYAQGVPANTSHNAYAVWLYSSPTSFKFVGFVPNLVGKNGDLSTEGKLPAGATRYKRLLITLETQSKPASPGEVVLSGPFRE